MYRNTRFGEILEGLPKITLDQVTKRHDADKYSKGFRCRDHLIAMIYSQLEGCKSLREIEASFNSQVSAHYHLNTRPIKRSTLADANRNRSSKFFEDLCGKLIQQAHKKLKKEVKDLLYLLDSTPIPLKGLGYEWTEGRHNYRTRGLKIHMLYSPQQQIPVDAQITYSNVNDVTQGREIDIEKNATYVFDKGYYNYNWWYQINEKGAYFVTRAKSNVALKIESIADLSQEEKANNIIDDSKVSFKAKRPRSKRVNHYYGTDLRRVTVNRPDKDRPLVLLTNDFTRSAEEIADLYKKRWGIELFFKWLKQNLKIKKFLGRSENAVKIQIYTALITYLLVHMNHRENASTSTLKMWLVELKAGLFQRPETEQYTAEKRRRESEDIENPQGVLVF